jgi:hypothetical protein
MCPSERAAVHANRRLPDRAAPGYIAFSACWFRTLVHKARALMAAAAKRAARACLSAVVCEPGERECRPSPPFRRGPGSDGMLRKSLIALTSR